MKTLEELLNESLSLNESVEISDSGLDIEDKDSGPTEDEINSQDSWWKSIVFEG